MPFESHNGVNINILSISGALVTNLDTIDDILKELGLNIPEGLMIECLAVWTNGHVSVFCSLIFDQTCVTNDFRTLAALLGVNRNGEANKAPH